MYNFDTQNDTFHTDAQEHNPPPCVHIGQLVAAYEDFEDAVLGAAQVGVDLNRTITVTNIETEDFTGYGVWCPIAWDFNSIEQAETAMSLFGTASGGCIRLFEGSMCEEVEA